MAVSKFTASLLGCAIVAFALLVMPRKPQPIVPIDPRIAVVGLPRAPLVGDELALLRQRLVHLALPVKRRSSIGLRSRHDNQHVIRENAPSAHNVTHHWSSQGQRASIFVGLRCTDDCANQIQLLFVHAAVPHMVSYGVVGDTSDVRQRLSDFCPAATATVCASDQTRIRRLRNPSEWDPLPLWQEEDIIVLIDRQVRSVVVGWDEIVRQRVKSASRRTIFTVDLDGNHSAALCRVVPTTEGNRHGVPRIAVEDTSFDVRTPFASNDVVFGLNEVVQPLMNAYRFALPNECSKGAKIWGLSSAVYSEGLLHVAPALNLFNATSETAISHSNDSSTFLWLSRRDSMLPFLTSAGLNAKFELSTSKSACKRWKSV